MNDDNKLQETTAIDENTNSGNETPEVKNDNKQEVVSAEDYNNLKKENENLQKRYEASSAEGKELNERNQELEAGFANKLGDNKKTDFDSQSSDEEMRQLFDDWDKKSPEAKLKLRQMVNNNNAFEDTVKTVRAMKGKDELRKELSSQKEDFVKRFQEGGESKVAEAGKWFDDKVKKTGIDNDLLANAYSGESIKAEEIKSQSLESSTSGADDVSEKPQTLDEKLVVAKTEEERDAIAEKIAIRDIEGGK